MVSQAFQKRCETRAGSFELDRTTLVKSIGYQCFLRIEKVCLGTSAGVGFVPAGALLDVATAGLTGRGRMGLLKVLVCDLAAGTAAPPTVTGWIQLAGTSVTAIGERVNGAGRLAGDGC